MMNKRGIGLRPMVVNVSLIVLFSLFMLTFIGLAIQDRNPSSEVLNPKYGLNRSIGNMNDILTDFSQVSDNVRLQMGSSSPTAVDFIFLIFQGAFFIPKAFLSFVFNGVTSITTMLFSFLGGSGLGTILSATLGVLFSSMLITIVLLIVKAVRTGESER